MLNYLRKHVLYDKQIYLLLWGSIIVVFFLLYNTLEYISFFTVGSDEVRAWNLIKGETALSAAAAIHTDLACGFIRAECFSYSDTVEFWSEKNIREKGHFRLEGKNYIVQDGDILGIRFNV